MNKTKIRKIIEEHATVDTNEWCDVYQSIKDHDFDKLEEELQEYMNKIPIINYVKHPSLD